MTIYEIIKTKRDDYRRNQLSDTVMFVNWLIAEIENKCPRNALGDENVTPILKNILRKFEDIPNQDKFQLHFIKDLLPQQMTEDEIRNVLVNSNLQTMPERMTFLKENYTNLYDGKMASGIAKSL